MLIALYFLQTFPSPSNSEAPYQFIFSKYPSYFKRDNAERKKLGRAINSNANTKEAIIHDTERIEMILAKEKIGRKEVKSRASENKLNPKLGIDPSNYKITFVSG